VRKKTSPPCSEPPEPWRPRHSAGERFVARVTLLCFLFGTSPVGAAETALGPVETVSGVGVVSSDTASHTILTSDTASVHYAWGVDPVQPAGHTLEFVQRVDGVLDASAIAYNTSPGLRPTEFFGSVLANGTVVFANPAGVYFQDGSFVDVGNLIAGAGNLIGTPAAGADLGFTNLAGEVLNRGEIHAGSVSLLGARVANFGHIQVDDGSLMLLAGDEIWLTEHGSPIHVQLDSGAGLATDAPPEPAVENAGSLDAGRGRVRLAAGDGLAFAIRTRGSIRGREIVLDGGDGGLVEVSGRLDATDPEAGGIGGRIDVLGGYVAIEAGAELDASGHSGGGEIRVGGDEQGQGDLRRARATWLSPEASLRADATEAGDGGRVVVWSDEISRLWGSISALGGPLGGRGGFVETSSRGWLDLHTTPEVHTRSNRPGDVGGLWLIDPNNIRIIDPADTCGSAPQCLDVGLDPDKLTSPIYFNPFEQRFQITIAPTVDDSLISADRIAQALGLGTDVTLTTRTFGSDPGGQEGNITVDGEIWIPAGASYGVDENTRATLSLVAANHLSVNERIGTDHPEMTLDLKFNAADINQPQLDVEDGQVHNIFRGDLLIDAPLATQGGDVLLTGAGVRITDRASIVTEGGVTEIYAGGSTLRIEGQIDTRLPGGSSDTDGFGGDVFVQAVYPTALLDFVGEYVKGSGQLELLPGHVELGPTAEIRSGGGNVSLTADGDLILEGAAAIDSGLSGGSASDGAVGGTVRLTAGVVGLTTGDVTSNAGGLVRTAAGTTITTGGGGLAISTSLGDAEQEARLDLAGTWNTASGQPGQSGGGIGIKLEGVGHTRLAADVTTAGGSVLVTGDRLQIESARIDARSPGDPAIEHGTIQVEQTGSVDVLGTSELSGGQVKLLAGTSGTGDLSFDPSSPVTIRGDRIGLGVGDGYNLVALGEDLNDSARIVLGQAHFESADDPNLPPETFSLLQDAALAATAIPQLSRFGDGSGIAGMEYVLESADHSIEIADASLVAGSRLRLIAGQGVTIDQPLSLASLGIEIAEDFTVDPTLASRITGSAPEISITAGASDNSESGSLLVEGDLTAQSLLTLHAGAGGRGDLSFRTDGSPVVLQSDDVVLRAGSGEASPPGLPGNEAPPSRVLVAGTGPGAVQIRSGDGSGRPGAFTLRQDADIDDATLPETTQFGLAGQDPIGDVRYTLRSDAGSIRLTDAARTNRIADSQLSLLARTDIELPDSGSASLRVRSLEIGGLDSFVFESSLLDRVSFTDDTASRLVLRAGVDASTSGALLSFGQAVTLTADEIRLAAGDGFGGGFDDASIVIADDVQFRSQRPDPGAPGNVIFGAPTTFVFEQDASIVSAPDTNPLPSLANNFSEGAPATFGVRSNAGAISLVNVSQQPPATSRVVLSADTVQIERSDGSDIDLARDFGTGVAVEIRAGSVDLAAQNATADGAYASEPANAAQVLPGTLQLRGFDGGADAPAFDPDAVLATSPDLLSVRQDADVTAANLIDPTQLGAGFRPRDATGKRQAVDLDGDGEPELLAPVRYQLTSTFGSITLTPDRVGSTGGSTDFGSELQLTLGSVPELALPGYVAPVRTITFGNDAYRLESLGLTTPDALQVNAGARLTAWDSISIAAATQGRGNLGFDSGVELTARTLELAAGGAGALLDEDGNPLPLPVVDARSNAPLFTFSNAADPDEPAPQPGSLATAFTIRQDGAIVDTAASAGASQVPAASQLVGDIGTYSLESRLGDVRIDDLANLPAADLGTTRGTRLEIRASSTEVDQPSVLIHIGNGGVGDLDFTPYASALLVADEIELEARGAGSRVLADNADVIFEGASSDPDSNLRFSLIQETELDASALPQRTQFAAGIGNVEIHAESTAAGIQIDQTFANRVRGTALELVGAADLVFDEAGQTLDMDLVSLHATSTGGVLSASDADIATSGDQTWDGDLVLAGDVSLLGANVVFSGNVTGAGRTLHLLTTGHSVFHGDVGTASERLALLRVDFDARSDTIARLQFGDDVSSSQTVHADQVLIQAVTPDAEGGVPTPRSVPIASVFKRAGSLDFDVTNDFLLGEGEKISVAGDLSITAGGQARIGDLAAFDVTVTAPTIAIMRRSGGAYLDSRGGVREDAGVDFVANRIRFDGEILLTGGGANPSFALPDPVDAPSWMAPFSVTAIHTDKSPLTRADFDWIAAIDPNLFPDLHPSGPTRDDVSSTFYGQDLVPSPRPFTPDGWLPASDAALIALDIRTRPATPQERRRYLEGAHIIDDVGLDVLFAGEEMIQVAENRLIARDADRAVALYDKIFGPAGERAPHVRELMQSALDQYRHSSGTRSVVGFELRRYVKNRPSSLFEVYQTLEDLDALFGHHRALGLTPGEYGPVQLAWLEAIQPEGISLEELSEAIHPSRYVRGSDILDIFGD